MLKIKKNRKLMIPILAIVLVVAMAGSALAYIEYTDLTWSGQLGTNSKTSYDTNETRLIQTLLTTYGSFSDSISGRYYQSTHDAVEDYQQGNIQLNDDGIVGSYTWYWLQNSIENDGGTYYSSYSNRNYHRICMEN